MPKKLKRQSKTKTFIFSFVILLLSCSFVSPALAVDDNANDPACGIIGCDTNPFPCGSRGFDWEDTGYPGSFGNDDCCGDDSGEYFYEGNYCAGLIDSCGTIIDTSGTYVLNSDLNCNKNGIIVNADNVTIDCNGQSIVSTLATPNEFMTGIEVNGDNIIVKNCNITKFGKGIYLATGTSGAVISPNNNFDLNIYGIYIDDSGNNTISSNNFDSNSSWGIRAESSNSQNNIITSNTLDSCGILLGTMPSNNTISSNIINNASVGIDLYIVSNNEVSNNSGNNTNLGIKVNPILSTSNYGCNNTITGGTEDCSNCTEGGNHVNECAVADCSDYCDVCGDNTTFGDEGDVSQNACELYATNIWSLTDGDSPSICWQSGRDDPYLCCGDDTDEAYKYCTVGPSTSIAWSCLATDQACCNYSSYCVKDGNCYIGSWSQYLGLNPGGNDNNVVCSSGNWYDPDTMPLPMASFCGGMFGIYAGEAGVGEYTDTITLECCGDDTNENYITTDCDSNPVSLCCPDDKLFVRDGSCVVSCTGCGDNAGYGYEGDMDEGDCNIGSWALTTGNATSICWNVSHNPYRCCGDDSNEYHKDCISASGAVCDMATKSTCCYAPNTCIYAGVCYDINDHLNTADTSNDLEVCEGDATSAQWEDLDLGNDASSSPGTKRCDFDGFTWLSASSYCSKAGPGDVCDDADGGAFCCGDDDNEYYVEICPGVTGVERKCCSLATDKIDEFGECTNSCPNAAPTITLTSPPDTIYCVAQSGANLTWDGEDPNGDSLQYHIYLSSSETEVQNLEAAAYINTVIPESYITGALNYNDTYYWRIVADDSDLQTASEVWSFSTEVCDSTDPCCEAGGCDYKALNDQPTGYTDQYSCEPSVQDICGDSCDIESIDYYCNGTDSFMHQTSGSTGVTCDECEVWDGADACDITACGSECSSNTDCDPSTCHEGKFYQTRSPICQADCECPAFGLYDTCQKSWEECSQTVECYKADEDCNTDTAVCECIAGYIPDLLGGCVSNSFALDFDFCITNYNPLVVQFTVTDLGGQSPHTFDWDFGDLSAHSSQQNPVHTYTVTDDYIVSLIVTDNNSDISQRNKQLELLTGSPPVPVCDPSFIFTDLSPIGSSQMALQWDTSLGALGYHIYRDDLYLTNSGYGCGPDTCSFTDTNLDAGTEYSYFIIAQHEGFCNSRTNPTACDGGYTSGSPPCSCSLSAYTTSDVEGLDVSSSSCGTIDVSWDDMGSDFTYHIYKDINSVGNIDSGDEIDSPSYLCDSTICSFSDDAIIPEEIYYYKITSESIATGESLLDAAPSGSAFSYCYKAPIWGEK